MVATLNYFAIRGRAEPIRLALAVANVDYEEVTTDFEAMKKGAGTTEFPFGQCPCYKDEDLENPISQMDAVVRHIARKHNLYGKNLAEQAMIDMILHGVEDSRTKYAELIYKHQLDEEKQKIYIETHCTNSTESIHGRNGGAHFHYFEEIVKRNGSSDFAVGNSVTIADIGLFDLIDLHCRPCWEGKLCMKTNFPSLYALYEKVKALEGIEKHLNGSRRHAQVNGAKVG